MYSHREPELEQFKSVWLTKIGHKILKDQKKIQKKSMAKLIEELIIEKYYLKN